VFCRRDGSTQRDKGIISAKDNCRIRRIQAGTFESVIQWAI